MAQLTCMQQFVKKQFVYTESLGGYTFEARIEKYFCFKVKLIFVDRNNSVDDRILLAWYKTIRSKFEIF